ncbi:MAG: hypothetical protein HY705_02845 [Gemmatimonadetes bacterium]|nr:hypothetical protein [Gemmatimonadota bacterium]
MRIQARLPGRPPAWRMVLAGVVAAAGLAASVPAPLQLPGFSHHRHRSVRCSACHDSRASDGGLIVRTREDCMRCHHSAENRGRCRQCHAPAELAGETYRPLRLTLTSWDSARTRTLPFRHEWHAGVACLDCHTPAATAAAPADCSSCHRQHHAVEPDRQCGRCHGTAARSAHTREAHRGCAGSGCHTNPMLPPLPPARSVCLACHPERERHYPARECAACHAVSWDGS